MTTQPNLAAHDAPVIKPLTKRDPARWFYTAAAALLLLLAFLGFHRFYLHGQAYPNRELTPPIRGQVILHGLVMSAWIVLFLVQPLLIAKRQHRLHMKLGWLGAALAAAVTLTGVRVGLSSAQVTPPEARIWGLPPREFLSVPLLTAIIFGIYVAVAVWQRRKPAAHRAMMLMATLSAMPAAISRIETLNELYYGTIWERLLGPSVFSAVVAAALVGVHWLLTRRVDRWLWGGFASLIVVYLITWHVGQTEAWVAMVGWMLD